MRSLNFRDNVLWAICYKLGLDPAVDLLADQARALAVYINSWVRRLWHAADWPEWTIIAAFVPANHVVPYSSLGASDLADIGRVFKVYLVDPLITPGDGLDTPHKLLATGIHVGFEHGPNVWIKYQIPPPRFTAAAWDNGRSYARNELSYSPLTGECYKSKVNKNLDHDPASTGSPNPAPPDTEITQAWTPDNPGIAERAETMVVHLARFTDGQVVLPPDPPPNESVYKIFLIDDGLNLIGSSFVTADGVMMLNDIIDTSVTQLIASLPGTFTVTGNHADKTITISDNSSFSQTGSTYLQGTKERWFVIDIEAYIPPSAAVEGAPQITRIAMSPATSYPGATYTATMTDSLGNAHSAKYESAPTDGASQILQGLLTAMEGSPDAYFAGVGKVFAPDFLRLDLSIKNSASLEVVTSIPSSSFWELVPFPADLVEPVVRGAYADALKEEGQSEKGAAEEQAVPIETQVRTGALTTQQFNLLSDQQAPKPGYASK